MYFLFASCGCYLFQSEHMALIYSWKLCWKFAHFWFPPSPPLTAIWKTLGKLHLVPTAMLIITHQGSFSTHSVHIRTHSVLKTVSIGNRFSWRYSVFLISVYHHRIWYFPVIGVKRGGMHVSTERGDIKNVGGEKRNVGWYTFLHDLFSCSCKSFRNCCSSEPLKVTSATKLFFVIK